MIYFDHAATAPLRREALEAMWPYLTNVFGNPSSSHELGRQARVGLENARAEIAGVLGCSPGEITFTSGGTEADNLAVAGFALGATRGRRIVTTAIEHQALLETCASLRRDHGFEVVFAPIDRDGLVDLTALDSLLTPETTLCSVMYANNEIGTVQPIAESAALCRAAGVPFHTDAVQAAGLLTLDVDELNVDMLSISAHKFGGPKGIGALYVRSGRIPQPLIYGGGQEHGFRSGTESVASAAGMAKALTLAAEDRIDLVLLDLVLRDRLIDAVLKSVDGAILTGSQSQRLPNHASFCFANTFGESVLVELENDGIICSSGSACAAGSDEVSHVLTAIGIDDDLARTAVRLTFGPTTSEEDINCAIAALPAAVSRVRSLGLYSR